jgi:hypothetical protein
MTTGISARRSPVRLGWRESGQTPEFDEYTAVLKGELQVETRIATVQVHNVLAGQAIVIHSGESVRYSPLGGGREETIRGFAKSYELDIQIPLGREV